MRARVGASTFAVALAAVTPALPATAQVSQVPVQHPVYEWLHHQRVLGNAAAFAYEAQPTSRGRITEHLRAIEEERLGASDRDLLRAFLQEFSEEDLRASAEDNFLRGRGSIVSRVPRLFRENAEPHLFAHADSGYAYAVDIFWSGGGLSLDEGDEGERLSSAVWERGVRVYGSFYDRLGLHAEAGNLAAGDVRLVRLDPLYDETFEVVSQEKDNSLYFETMASLSYGVVGADIGHGALRYGPGLAGRSLLLSRDAGAFSWVRLGIDTRRFRLTSLHGSLASDTEDGVLVLGTDTLQARYARRRWMAFHRAEIRPFESLQVAFSEMLVYSLRGTDYAYLNPVTPLFFAELDNEDRDNALWVLDAVWRPVDGLEVHGSLLADDLQNLSDAFASDEGKVDTDRAFELGVDAAFPWGVDLGAQYARIEPFVYTHWQALNQVGQRGFPLGHDLGPNATLHALRARLWMPRRSWVALTLANAKRGLNPIDAEGNVTENVGGDLNDGLANTGYRLFEGADLQHYRVVALEGVTEPLRGLRLSVRYERRSPRVGTRIGPRDFFDVRLKIGY